MSEEIRSPGKRAYIFERNVASIYRALGAAVTHDIALAGNQIDILVQEKTQSGKIFTTAVECKSYSSPVGIEIINAFASIANLLKQRGMIDRATIVASSGFTRPARNAAEHHGIELLEIADLELRVQGEARLIQQAKNEFDQAQFASSSISKPKRVFVLMPFSPEFYDVYVLGIRDVAERLGFIVERADEIEHNDDVISVIKEKIRSSDMIIADTTTQNPNVLYEVGYAHGLDKQTVLISRENEILPFDVQSTNFILFSSIIELRDKLERRLKTMEGVINELRSSSRNRVTDDKLRDVLLRSIPQIMRISGVSIEDIGVHLWLVGNVQNYAEPILYRAVRVRLSDAVPSKRGIWRKSEGVVGTCWEKQSDVAIDLTNSLYQNLSEASWPKLPSDIRIGMTYFDFIETTRHFKAIFASPIVRHDKLIGCVSLNIDKESSVPFSSLWTDDFKRILRRVAADAGMILS